ncbi:Putative oxidoreductase [Klebsiella aerogenes]|nr:Putative oxidoreductase [Klebsiella aerogenes]
MGKNHWYHETQSTNSPVEILPLVPEAADVDDRFLLDLPLAADLSHPHEGWLAPARQLTKVLFPDKRHGNPITNLQRLRPSLAPP